MANQISINIGAAANDGTGDPLRTAFNDVNLNFANVWSTGLPNSNVQFSDNRILTTNTNANLVFAPNGIAKVASNVDIVPNTANVFGLGSPTRRWNTVYTQYLDASSEISGTLGNVTVAVANLHITGGTNGYVLQTDGTGNLTWTAQTGGGGNGVPGGANTQVQYNNAGSFGGSASFTFNNVSNVLTVNGNISATNVFTAETVTAHDAYIDTGTFSGDAVTGDGALYVGSPNFVSLGTDVMAQFTGNVTNYGQINFQNYSNSPTASGDYIATADNGTDSTHYIDMGITSSTWDGTQTNVLPGLAPNNGYLYTQDGNLTLGTRNGNTSYKWNFTTDGNLTVPGAIVGNGNIHLQPDPENSSAYLDIYLTAGPDIHIAGDVESVILGRDTGANVTANINGSVTIQADSGTPKVWTFGTDGNVNVPDNMVMQTTPTGFPFSSNIVGIVTGESTVSVLLAGTSFPGPVTGQVTIGGVVGTTEANDTWWFQANEVDSIELFTDSTFSTPVDGTEWTAYESGGFAVSAGSTDLVVKGGNVNITGGAWSWTFDAAGNLQLPGGGSIVNQDNTSILITNATVQDGEITLEANTDVNLYGGSPTTPSVSGGRVSLVGGDGGPDSGDGVGSGGWVEISGGTGAPAINGGAGFGGEVRITGGTGGAANSGNSIPAEVGGTVYIFGGQAGDVDGDNALAVNGTNVEIHGGLGSFNGSTMIGRPGDVLTQGGGNGWIGASGNVYSKTSSDGYSFHTWGYINNGQTIFPTLTVDLHNGGTQTGQTLQFGDPSQQAFITGPAPAPAGSNAQRLIIQGQNGGDGEGGDVYVWGGDSNVNGGDIKIYAGDADTAGRGGNIHVAGGRGTTNAGEITLTGGQNDGGVGAYVGLTGGRGSATGGNVDLNGGYGDGGGGTVNITGGIGNSLSNYGNVNINAGASTWTFDNTGNLTTPGSSGNISGIDTLSAPADLTIQNPSSIPNSTANINSQGGYNIGTYTGLATSGGTGTGLTVNASTAGNGYIDTVTINTPGSGYTEGDTITIVGGDGLGCTFTIGVAPNNWVFSTDGNFALNGSNIAGATNTVVTDGINSIALAPGATMDVFGFPFSGAGVRGQLTITGDITTTQALGTWYYQSVNNNYTYQLYTDSTYSTLVDASSWTAYEGGGSVAITKQNPASNVVIDSNGYFSTFGTDGTLSLPGDLDVAGDITGNGAGLTNVATQDSGSWTLTAGTNTVSFTVPLNGTYSMWVRGNIPNGIVVWNATATVTNNNVPAIGQQFGWYYPAPGNNLVLTSMPAQIIGTANTISNATPSVGTTTNVFEFNITNNSGNSQVVNWGYTKL
jgi:hypothetical protein